MLTSGKLNTKMPGLRRKKIRTVKLSNTNGDKANIPVGNVAKARPYLISGNCHSLAAAIHEITGFAFICFREINSHDSLVEYEPHIRHVAIISPEGWVIDGYGVTGLDKVSLERNWIGELYGSVEDLNKELDEDAKKYGRDWLPLEPYRVVSFALPIVSLYYID